MYTLESEDGQEIGGSRAAMCLRDSGRFALYVLGGGVIDGRETLPEGWVRECATSAFQVTDLPGVRKGSSDTATAGGSATTER